MHPSRREFLRFVATAPLAPLAARLNGQPATPDTTNRPLDVLVLMTDQWNPYNLGYERDPDVHTPNLDALARQSLNFSNCYSNCPVCMPARTSFISGLFPHNTGLWGNATKFYLPAEQMPLFSDIRARGYTTAQVGKLHWWSGNGYRRDHDSLETYFKALGLDHPDPIATPFSTGGDNGPYEAHLRRLGKLETYVADMTRRLKEGQFIPSPSPVAPEDHNDWFVADRSIAFLRAQPKEKPYFLITSFPGPHTPLDAMGRYLAMYDPGKMRLAANVQPTNNSGRTFSIEEIRACRASYLGKITMIDDCIGRIIATLKERGTWNKTLVFFTSDHGEMMGAQGKFGKGVFWEESARIPMLVRLPGQPNAGQRTDAPVQFGDVYATAVDAIGAQLSKGRFTRSFLPVVRGNKDQSPAAAFSEIQHQGTLNYMVRDRRHKWLVYGGKEHLFDLGDDPLEQRNLIGSARHRDITGSLKELQRQFITSTQVNLAADYKPLAQRVREGAR
jgi:arylsulfatase A-like enzyme